MMYVCFLAEETVLASTNQDGGSKVAWLLFLTVVAN